MKSRYVIIAMVLTLGLAACQRHPQADAAQGEVLLKTDQAFSSASASRGFASAFARYAETDAVLLPEGDTALKGGPEIRQSLARIPAGITISWTPQDAEASGSLGYSWGVYSSTGTDSRGQPTVAYGKYLSVWKRLDGHWKVAVMMTNQSPGPAG